MSHLIHNESVSVKDNDGSLHIFSSKEKVPTSLRREKTDGSVVIFTHKEDSFVFHIDVLRDYTSDDDFFPNWDSDLECNICGEYGNYSLVDFYRFNLLKDNDIDLDTHSISEMLHPTVLEPICDECMKEIFEATLEAIESNQTELLSSMI